MRTRTSQQLYRNPRWLFEQYWVENLSTIKLARMCNVAPCTIKRHMRKYEISTRTQDEAFQLNMDDSSFRDGKWLRNQYWEKGVTIRGIANLCGCDKKTIQYWMDRHDIKRRTKAEWQKDVIRANRERYHISWYSKLLNRVKRIVGNFDNYMVAKDRDN